MKTKLFATLIMLLSIGMIITSCADKNLRQGRILLTQDRPDYNAAIEQFKLSTEHNPKNIQAWLLMGEAYAELEKWEEMDNAFNKAVEIDPNTKAEIDQIREQKWKRVFDKGNAENEKQNFGEALKMFEDCMTIDPAKYESYYNAAIASGKLELEQKAYDYSKKAYEMNTEESSNIKLFAEICFQQNKYEESLAAFRKAKELEPGSAFIDLRIARMYETKEDYANASLHYEKALEISPGNSDIWFNLGVIYLQKLEDFPKAEYSFARAMTINPDDVDAAFNRIVVLGKLERNSEAIPIIQILEEKDSTNCDIYDLAASIYQELGDKTKVNEYIAKGKKCTGE